MALGVPISHVQVLGLTIELRGARLPVGADDAFGVRFAEIPARWKHILVLLTPPLVMIVIAAALVAARSTA